MFRKSVLIAVSALLCLQLSGCSPDSEIDKAAVAETVTVQKNNGGTAYTFYTLSPDNSDTGITVSANSFEAACAIAKESYIPNLSLSRLELMIYEDSFGLEFMQRDFEYISRDYRLSPLITVSLADKKTFEIFEENRQSFEDIEQQIILLENKNPDVSCKLLSIYNKNKADDTSGIVIPYLTADEHIKCDYMEISAKK